jgi:hypothetical protein
MLNEAALRVTENWMLDFHNGSKPDMALSKRDVRSTPKSRHSVARQSCPLSARLRHSPNRDGRSLSCSGLVKMNDGDHQSNSGQRHKEAKANRIALLLYAWQE